MSKTEIDDLIKKSKNTGILLEKILKNLTEVAAKTSDDFIQHKSTSSFQTSENNECDNNDNSILVIMKHIDILLSELFYETIEYNKMSKSISAFVSESHISPEKIQKSNILTKLGIISKKDNEKITENLKLPIIYFMTFYFMTAIKEDYQKVLNTFYNRQNDIVNKCEECVIKNASPEIEKKPSSFLNNKSNNQNKDVKVTFCINILHKANKPIINKPKYLEKIQEETQEDRLNNSNDEIKRDSCDQDTFGPDLDFSSRRTRAQTMRRNMFIPKKFIGAEEEETKKEIKEIKETVKKENIRKKSLNDNAAILNTLAALKVDFTKVNTDEEKLKKMEKCPFIEQIEIYY